MNRLSVVPESGDSIGILESELRLFADRVEKLKHVVQGEEATKMSFIVPFLLKLGWDVYNPLEVAPEYTCDVGIKKGEKVDYALIIDETPILILEAKDWKQSISSRLFGQLYRYFVASEAKIGVISNGLEYQFYTDSIKENIMDESPFFTFRLDRFTRDDVEMLYRFSRGEIQSGGIETVLESMQLNVLSEEVKNWLLSQKEQPSASFVRLMRSNVLTSKVSNQIAVKAIKYALDSMSFEDNEKINNSVKGEATGYNDSGYNEDTVSNLNSDEKSSKNTGRETKTKKSELDSVDVDINVGSGFYRVSTADSYYPMGCRLVAVSFDNSKWYSCTNVTSIWVTLIEYLLEHGKSFRDIVELTKLEYFSFSFSDYGFRTPKQYKSLYFEGNRSGKDSCRLFKVVLDKIGIDTNTALLCFINNEEAKKECRGYDSAQMLKYCKLNYNEVV